LLLPSCAGALAAVRCISLVGVVLHNDLFASPLVGERALRSGAAGSIAGKWPGC